MSGDKKNPDPHQEERQEALAQNGALDAFTSMTRIVNPFGGPSVRGFHFGSTSFEGYDLNDMIDIVESADPGLVDSAGEALIAARDAIKDAAGELSRNLGKIDWQGEAHTAFSDWAGSLVKTAEGIADYADVIGTQVLAAGSGLASVRKSMPPRDSRTDPKAVEDIPEAERVDSNDEYTAAVKAEGHRQEGHQPDVPAGVVLHGVGGHDGRRRGAGVPEDAGCGGATAAERSACRPGNGSGAFRLSRRCPHRLPERSGCWAG
ncbi:WXG100 family type VII secretion target [Streptomyces sp. SAI-229]|uniref:WXG100 family type VII secretion target n=1 Tax=Streptomyces sp. SAI-229 TaxID=3377731 RepID=UPI003C7A04EB